MTDFLLLSVAAFCAGALNAVAGGGSFLTLPALIYCGVPPVLANATGTVALLPGYAASSWGFRHELRQLQGLNVSRLLLLSLLGGSLGAGLLLLTDNRTFSALIPWLLLLATLLFAGAPWLTARRADAARASPRHSNPASATASATASASASPTLALATLFAVALYGGYFNGGLGILLLAALSLLGQRDLHAINGVKNLVSMVLTAIAVVIYAAGDVVVWPYALVMMLAASVGGLCGAGVAKRLPAAVLRTVIIGIGAIMTALFFATASP